MSAKKGRLWTCGPDPGFQWVPKLKRNADSTGCASCLDGSALLTCAMPAKQKLLGNANVSGSVGAERV